MLQIKSFSSVNTPLSGLKLFYYTPNSLLFKRRCFCIQPNLVCDQATKFWVRRLAFRSSLPLHIQTALVNGVHSAFQRHFYAGMTGWHVATSAWGCLMFLGNGRIQNLGNRIQHFHIIDCQDNGISDTDILDMRRNPDLMMIFVLTSLQIMRSVIRLFLPALPRRRSGHGFFCLQSGADVWSGFRSPWFHVKRPVYNNLLQIEGILCDPFLPHCRPQPKDGSFHRLIMAALSTPLVVHLRYDNIQDDYIRFFFSDIQIYIFFCCVFPTGFRSWSLQSLPSNFSVLFSVISATSYI